MGATEMMENFWIEIRSWNGVKYISKSVGIHALDVCAPQRDRPAIEQQYAVGQFPDPVMGWGERFIGEFRPLPAVPGNEQVKVPGPRRGLVPADHHAIELDLLIQGDLDPFPASLNDPTGIGPTISRYDVCPIVHRSGRPVPPSPRHRNRARAAAPPADVPREKVVRYQQIVSAAMSPVFPTSTRSGSRAVSDSRVR